MTNANKTRSVNPLRKLAKKIITLIEDDMTRGLEKQARRDAFFETGDITFLQ